LKLVGFAYPPDVGCAGIVGASDGMVVVVVVVLPGVVVTVLVV
jgi:hypothetical protein